MGEFADLLWFHAEENMLCIFVRCDLVIAANGNMEKIASGLLERFLAHLKTARDQIAKGGYSIALEPDPGSDVTWFTKGTMERSVSLSCGSWRCCLFTCVFSLVINS